MCAKFFIENMLALMVELTVDPYQSGLLDAVPYIFQFDPTRLGDSIGQLFEVLRHLLVEAVHDPSHLDTICRVLHLNTKL
jgi:hypothetical protein